jgi:peptidoglycan/LPS O-acetylase OafA/YrhL
MDLLNIIRGLAAISVVFWHGFGAYHVNDIAPFLNVPGRTAVWIFFGISGYVISYGFIYKKYCYSLISLKNFYINRLLRIYPLFICISLFAWIIEYYLSGVNPLRLQDIYSQFLGLQFNHNYTLNGVFWTLGVEIHFYLIAPAICLLFTILNKKKSVVVGILFYVALVGLQDLLVNKYGWNYDGRNIISNLPHFFIGIIGCFFVSGFKPSNFRLVICIFISIFFLVVTNYLYHKNATMYWSPIGILLIDALILILIIAHASINKDVSNSKIYLVFSFLGSISYGIYAWHPLLMRFIDNIQIQPFYVSVLILFITIVIAAISFKVMEKPSLKLRRY